MALKIAAGVLGIVLVLAFLAPPVIKAYSDALERNTRSASDSTLLSRQLVRLYRVELGSRQALTAAGGAEAATQGLATEFGEFQRDHRSLTASGVLDRATADYTGEALATIETIEQDGITMLSGGFELAVVAVCAVRLRDGLARQGLAPWWAWTAAPRTLLAVAALLLATLSFSGASA